LFDVLGESYMIVGNPDIVGPMSRPEDCVGICIPYKNAWLAHEMVLQEIMRNDEEKPILFCAGMMSNVLIDELWWMYPDGTYIDMGSALDPHCGISSRRYHREMLEKGRP